MQVLFTRVTPLYFNVDGASRPMYFPRLKNDGPQSLNMMREHSLINFITLLSLCVSLRKVCFVRYWK